MVGIRLTCNQGRLCPCHEAELFRLRCWLFLNDEWMYSSLMPLVKAGTCFSNFTKLFMFLCLYECRTWIELKEDSCAWGPGGEENGSRTSLLCLNSIIIERKMVTNLQDCAAGTRIASNISTYCSESLDHWVNKFLSKADFKAYFWENRNWIC